MLKRTLLFAWALLVAVPRRVPIHLFVIPA